MHDRKLGTGSADFVGGVHAPGPAIQDFCVFVDDRLEVLTRTEDVPGNHVALAPDVTEMLDCEAHYFDVEGKKPRRRILVCSGE
ncbi:MAG: hypothetical protein OXU19_15585 [bacterium]|nr:hypothetical protein [bacterium]MDE2767402.1 hypothetical protein [Chloroflexota bacterium]